MRKPPDLYKKIIMFLGDVGIIVLAIYLSVGLRLDAMNILGSYFGATLFVVIIFVLGFYIFDLYDPRRKVLEIDFLAHFIVSIIFSTIMTGMVFYALLYWKFGRGITLLNAIFIGGGTYLWRVLFKVIFSVEQRKRKVVIVGAGASGRAMYHVLEKCGLYEIRGFIDDDPSNINKRIGECQVIGDSLEIQRLIECGEVDDLVVAITYEKKKTLMKNLLEAKLKGVGVFGMQSAYENITGKLPATHLEEGWFAFTQMQGMEQGVYKIRVKGILSFFFAGVLLFFTLPIMVVIAIAIKLDSPGPVFYRQKRVGIDGKLFEMAKFRSMCRNAEVGEAVWSEADDSRVTRIGAIIRRLRVDELPQLVNILKGEMSLVGPRPERPEFVEQLQKTIPFYFIRHVIKPGLTGWAQVNYKYGSSKEDALEKLQYDLFYVKNMSFMLDVKIIFRTIRVVIFGARER